MAGDAAAGQGGDGAAQNGQQQGEGQAAPDYGQMTEQLQALAQGQEQMREYLQTNPWAAQEGGEPEQEAEQPQYDLSQLGIDESYMDDAQAEQFRAGLNDLIQQAAGQIVDQRLGPVNQQLSNFQMEREAERIVNEHPDLGTPEVANEVVGLTHQYVEQNMSHLPPEMQEAAKNSPAMWRLMYLANRGVQAANEEGASDGAQAATLEGGGGAAPAGATREGPYFRNDGESGVKLPF